jgi:DNA (cytosine-5)-methyltransferase 1
MSSDQKNKKIKAVPPTYISLFSGCGGFDDGFQKQGFRCVGAYDIDPTVIEVHRNNIGGPAYVHDLLDPNLPGNHKPGTVDIVISGSPCQGFSTVGQRKVNDPRNKLLLVGGQIAINLKAKVFVAENVMGSTAGKHKKYWEKLEKMMQDNGYATEILKCDATKLGIAQLRKRVIMIAWKGKKKIKIDLPELPAKTLRDVLKDVQGLPNHIVTPVPENDIIYRIAQHIKPNQKLSNVRGGERAVHTWDIPEVFGKVNESEKQLLLLLMRLRRQRRVRDNGDADPVPVQVLQKEFKQPVKSILNNLEKKQYIRRIDTNLIDLANTFNGKFRRLSWDKPSPTVDTRFGSPRYFLHPEEHRGFTPREAARIQGFRDDFVLLGTIDQQYTMIGNAVPPPMAEVIARTIKESIFI